MQGLSRTLLQQHLMFLSFESHWLDLLCIDISVLSGESIWFRCYHGTTLTVSTERSHPGSAAPACSSLSLPAAPCPSGQSGTVPVFSDARQGSERGCRVWDHLGDRAAGTAGTGICQMDSKEVYTFCHHQTVRSFKWGQLGLQTKLVATLRHGHRSWEDKWMQIMVKICFFLGSHCRHRALKQLVLY